MERETLAKANSQSSRNVSSAIFCASSMSPRTSPPEGHETPLSNRPTSGIELLDVRHGAAGQPISSARFAADHLKLTTGQPLPLLVGCEPGAKERERSPLGLAPRIGKPSAPTMPHLVQTIRGPNSFTRR
jgi:hypothetical protein